MRPNKKRIQPNQQTTDENPGIASPQSHRRTYAWSFIAEVALGLTFIIIPFSVQAGFLGDLFAKQTQAASVSEIAPTQSAVDAPLLTALQNPNPLGARGGAELIVDEGALVSTGPVGKDEIDTLSSNSGEIRVYTVREGDSLSRVAEMFNVTTNTIMWANDLTKATAIQPGDTLVILPIVGVRHVVKDGDTISTIAKKYEGDVDEILSFNQLTKGDALTVGDTLIIPGGALHSAPAKVSVSAQPVRVTGATNVDAGGFFSHPVPGAVKTQGIHGYNAVDLASPGGVPMPIRAAAAGEVIVAKSSGWNGGYGNYIVIKHSNGTQTLYSHLASLNVGIGAYVGQGETIGVMGNSGRSTGTHLHFEVRGARNPF